MKLGQKKFVQQKLVHVRIYLLSFRVSKSVYVVSDASVMVEVIGTEEAAEVRPAEVCSYPSTLFSDTGPNFNHH